MGFISNETSRFSGRARGTHTAESDVDIAVIVTEYTKTMHDSMTDFIVDLELEYNEVFSVLLIDYDKFNEWGNVMPFYKMQRKKEYNYGRQHKGFIKIPL